jgi:hypothetical protein
MACAELVVAYTAVISTATCSAVAVTDFAVLLSVATTAIATDNSKPVPVWAAAELDATGNVLDLCVVSHSLCYIYIYLCIHVTAMC